LFLQGRAYWQVYDYPRSIELAFKGLTLSQELKDDKLGAVFLYGISVCYADANDTRKAIYYSLADIPLAEKVNDHQLVSSIYKNLADHYIKLNMLDSALNFMNQSYQVCSKYHIAIIGYPIMGLGDIEDKLQHPEVAMSYYHLAVVYFKKNDSAIGLTKVYQRIAGQYARRNRLDSALFYANAGYNLAEHKKDASLIYETANLLSKLYNGNNEMESLRFFKIASISKDSLNLAEKEKQFQIVTIKEQQHQQELAEQKRIEQEETKQNLQLIAIATFIPLFLFVVLLLSRTRISRRLIDFLGVLSLLLLFEFVTLLIHPWISKITHHTPVLELLILVCIAAVIVQAHHNLSHWLKQKLSTVSKPDIVVEDEHD